jgi:AAA ATPase domain/Adenylate and Guanylate cyclase catalytic domain
MGGEVFGDAPNIAARVQAAADPGSVLITTNVHRQVAGLFVVEERGAHELKGASTPVALYRVVRASGGRRFGARTLTSLVGRAEELDLLRRRWERAVKGEGQLALVVGEPGIGKSRLVEEFRLKLGETPHTLGRILIVATIAEYAVAPDRGMGMPALRRRRHPGWPTARRP